MLALEGAYTGQTTAGAGAGADAGAGLWKAIFREYSRDLAILQSPDLAISRFANLEIWQSPDLVQIRQSTNLAISRFGNLQIWQPPDLAISGFGNLPDLRSQSPDLAISRFGNIRGTPEKIRMTVM